MKGFDIVSVEGYQANTLFARKNGQNKRKVRYNNNPDSVLPDKQTAMKMLKDMN
jgi:hypothetical protein